MKNAGGRYAKTIRWDKLNMELLDDTCRIVDFILIGADSSAFDDGTLDKINRSVFRHGKPSLYIRAQGSKVVLGPLCIPDSESCCYAEVLKGWPSFFPDAGGHSLKTFLELVGPPAFFRSAAEFAAAIATDALTLERRNVLTNRLWIMEWCTGELKMARILKNPRCPVCSRLARGFSEERVVDE
jgi:bacteriocin biosynthesis cyclodehydratase domain-containing protein